MESSTNAIFAGLKRDEQIKQMHAELDRQVAAIQTSADWVRWLDVANAMHSYSFRNTVLIFVQRPNATMVGGAGNLWRSKFNRYPMAGEKAIWIFAPLLRKRTRAELEANPNLSERVCFGFKPVPVFDVSQTDGEPMPKNPMRAERDEGQAPKFMHDGIVTMLSRAKFTLAFADPENLHGADGITRYLDKTVHIAKGMSQARTIKTEVHELAHVMLHDPAEDGRPSHVGDVEVEAESVAYLVLGHYGVDPDAAYSWQYVAKWAGRSTDAVQRSAERAMSCARKIIDAMSAHEEDDR